MLLRWVRSEVCRFCTLFAVLVSWMLGIALTGLKMLNQVVFCCLFGQLRVVKILSGTVNVLKHSSVSHL